MAFKITGAFLVFWLTLIFILGDAASQVTKQGDENQNIIFALNGNPVTGSAGPETPQERFFMPSASFLIQLGILRMIMEFQEKMQRNFKDKCEIVPFPVENFAISDADRDRFKKIKPPELSWLQTPSIVNVGPGHYQAIGRVIHLNHLKELLQKQKSLDFDATRKNMDNLVPQLDILADTLYLEGKVYFYGIKVVKIYVREITATYDSRAYFYAPNWKEQYSKRVITGTDGDDGKHGIDGTEVYIYSDVVNGVFEITSRGGDGQKGQDGGNGAPARDRSSFVRPDRPYSICRRRICPSRKYHPGIPGVNGLRGGDGGNAGTAGNGGNAGDIIFRTRKINGKVTVKTCNGKGALAAKNGQGGRVLRKILHNQPAPYLEETYRVTTTNISPGGAGGLGGRGMKCKQKLANRAAPRPICSGSLTDRAPNGRHGPSGAPGKTSDKPGKDGEVDNSNINFAKYFITEWNELDTKTKRDYPLPVINIIRREAEDLLLSNSNDQKGRDALKFILSLTNERGDLEAMKKDVKQKLSFLGQEGYDIFGKNNMFAPRVKWQYLEHSVEEIKAAAQSYENAFNDIMSSIEQEQNFKKIASKMSAVVGLQVNAEKQRLEEAKLIAESEKRAYVKSIQHLEEQMSSILEQVTTSLPDVHAKAKFNSQDFIALLQGLAGFSSGVATKDPFKALESALNIAGSFSGKQCLKSLESYMGSIKQWLTFGKHYKPLVDSSDLDFDQMEVSSVPQIMQANLEMNKEKFAAELVCMVDVNSLQKNVAEFQQLVESFFIAGAARIDLIAEIMNLDNDIGGYNFDIPLLAQTEQAIEDATQTKDAPITRRIQQMFMDNLLSTYRELERSFMKKVYELYKAFKFRTLWEGHNPLVSFRRVASESAKGTGRLNGVVQLTGVLRKFKNLKDKANKCFTFVDYTTDIHRWSFDNVKDKQMFDELASKGYTRFSINIDDKDIQCKKCYNMRLLKIYIELLGNKDQPQSVPRKIYLELRHLSASFFRVPVTSSDENSIKQYYQPLASYKTIKFNRFTLTNEEECRKRSGKSSESKCLSEDDSRWEAMCNHVLNKRGSHSKDALLGMEECQSPFGVYELKIPIDKSLQCKTNTVTTKNCKDLDLTKFTKLNVWTHYVFWNGEYPKSPDDIVCRKSQQKKRNETATA